VYRFALAEENERIARKGIGPRAQGRNRLGGVDVLNVNTAERWYVPQPTSLPSVAHLHIKHLPIIRVIE
jgi:hypothetical protein